MKKILSVLVLLSFLWISGHGQTLDSIPGKVKTIYTANFKARALALQKLITNAESFYQQRYPAYKLSARLNVLAKTDWENQVKIPYGIPYNWRNNIYVGADKKYIASLFGVAVKPGDEQLEPFDALAVHELGHYFFLTVVNIDTDVKWIDEFLASYFLIAYAEQAKINAALPPVGISNPAHKSLVDFEKIYLGVGPQNYDWYQRQFLKLGHVLYPRLKLKLIDAFIANYASGNKKQDPLVLLKSLAPAEVDQWLKTMAN